MGQPFALVDRASGETRWHATRLDLIFGANAELRQIAELYAGVDGEDGLGACGGGDSRHQQRRAISLYGGPLGYP